MVATGSNRRLPSGQAPDCGALRGGVQPRYRLRAPRFGLHPFGHKVVPAMREIPRGCGAHAPPGIAVITSRA